MKKPTKWAKGFFRLWIVYGIIVVSICGGVIFWDNQYENINNLPVEKYLYSKKYGQLKKSAPGVREWADKKGRSYIQKYAGNDLLLFPRTLSKKNMDQITAKHLEGLKIKSRDTTWGLFFNTMKHGLIWIFFPLLFGLTIRWIYCGFKQMKISEEVES